MRYKLRSGLEVVHRSFQKLDAGRCSQILLRNFEPLKSDLGHDRWQEYFGQVYTPANLPMLASERDYHVVTVPGGKVIGLMGFISGYESEVSNLSVDHDFQRNGLGKLLTALGLLKKIKEGVTEFSAAAGLWSNPILVSLGFAEDPNRSHGYGKHVQSLYVRADDNLVRKAETMLKSILQEGGEAV